jgi:Tfp pilus assembly protein PilZ
VINGASEMFLAVSANAFAFCFFRAGKALQHVSNGASGWHIGLLESYCHVPVRPGQAHGGCRGGGFLVSSTQPRYPISLRVALSGTESGAFAGEVTNISVGGMFVRTDRAPAVGMVVCGELEIPDGDRPAPIEAKVIHVASAPVPSWRFVAQPGFGAQFVRTERPFQERMHRYVQSIESASSVPVTLLLIARDLLYEKGWTQLTERDPAGSYCLTGALSHVAAGDREIYRAALRALGPRLGVPACAFGGFDCHCAALNWNDKEGRTRGQVVEKLDEVIALALGATATATA